jgi:peptidoglycan/xylan/chitin deacetylase (PgdA/CDA1 family)
MKNVVLCFHGVGRPERELEPGEERFWVDRSRFERLLDTAASDPRIKVTFDDGNASDASIALPALRSRGLTASFFVVAGRLGAPGSLAGDDVGALADSGMTIGSHGMHHRPWRSLGDRELQEELVAATEILSEASGRTVSEAACPFGAYDRRVLAATRRAGFERVYTVDRRPARPGAWLQARYAIASHDTPADVARFGREGARQAALRAAKATVKRFR